MDGGHLKTHELQYEEKPLFVPDLAEVSKVVRDALLVNFKVAEVKVTECPNLKCAPYCLMDSGLGGSPTLLEVGGPPFLLPLVQRNKIYNIKEMLQRLMGRGNVLAVGAGAGPHPLRGTNCEGIFNVAIIDDDDHDGGQHFSNGSYTAKVHGPEEECVLEGLPDAEERCALLLNMFVCRGAAGKVLQINCKQRQGSMNFVECIRKGLENKYKDQCVGLGGIFRITQGHIHQHVMRDFSSVPINTEEQLNRWLKFYEMPAPLNAVGTLITHEHGLDLRLQHFHSFSPTNWGGHYHFDTTPDQVEYEAYFNLAERVVRVDRPLETHQFGRD